MYNAPMENWFNLTVLSVALLISNFFLTKKIFNEQADVDPRLYGGFLQFAVGIIALPIALATGFQFELTTTSLLLLCLVVLSYTIGPSLYYVGLKHVELSEAMILSSVSVIGSLVLGVVLLGESLTWLKAIGAGLVFISVLIVTYSPGADIKTYSKYKIFLLVAPFFYVLAATFDNRLVGFSNATSYMSISFLLGGSFMLLTNMTRLKSVGVSTFKNRAFWKITSVNAVFIYLTYICVMRAYELGGEVSRMYPIQQSKSVLVPLIGIVLLKERNRVPAKILAAVVAFIGIILIKY